MQQTDLALDRPVPSPTPASSAADRRGFDIGWDHAHHGLVPPPEWLHADNPVCQGWLAAKAVFGRRVLPSRRSTRQWLALRLQALREGAAFDDDLLTPHHLSQLELVHCPVRRVTLGGSGPDAAVLQRLQGSGAYSAGRLATLSAEAAAALVRHSPREAVRRARSAEATAQAVDGLDAATWWRLAALRAMATPLPFAEAAALPLAVLPPNRVRLVNPVQALQALLTRSFLAPGWAERCRVVAERLPAHTLRLDFNLFVGAMAPRVLEAPLEPQARRQALEDAWLHERVQRRWTHFALALGEAGCETLLQVVAAQPVPGLHVVEHPRPEAQATASGLVRTHPRAAASTGLARSPRRGTTWRSQALQPAQEQLHDQRRQ